MEMGKPNAIQRFLKLYENSGGTNNITLYTTLVSLSITECKPDSPN